MRTLQCHHAYFSDFSVRDLFERRIDSWLYAANVISTALCLVDLVVRIGWVYDIGWEDGGGSKWAKIWLTVHFGFACFSTMIHVITHNMLSQEWFRKACRQPSKIGKHG